MVHLSGCLRRFGWFSEFLDGMRTKQQTSAWDLLQLLRVWVFCEKVALCQNLCGQHRNPEQLLPLVGFDVGNAATFSASNKRWSWFLLGLVPFNHQPLGFRRSDSRSFTWFSVIDFIFSFILTDFTDPDLGGGGRNGVWWARPTFLRGCTCVFYITTLSWHKKMLFWKKTFSELIRFHLPLLPPSFICNWLKMQTRVWWKLLHQNLRVQQSCLLRVSEQNLLSLGLSSSCWAVHVTVSPWYTCDAFRVSSRLSVKFAVTRAELFPLQLSVGRGTAPNQEQLKMAWVGSEEGTNAQSGCVTGTPRQRKTTPLHVWRNRKEEVLK